MSISTHLIVDFSKHAHAACLHESTISHQADALNEILAMNGNSPEDKFVYKADDALLFDMVLMSAKH